MRNNETKRRISSNEAKTQNQNRGPHIKTTRRIQKDEQLIGR